MRSYYTDWTLSNTEADPRCRTALRGLRQSVLLPIFGRSACKKLVRQELMRHASIQTKMNVYGQAMPESKREANGKVVTMVLKPLRASA